MGSYISFLWGCIDVIRIYYEDFVSLIFSGVTMETTATHVIVRLSDGSIFESVGDKANTEWDSMDWNSFFQLRTADLHD